MINRIKSWFMRIKDSFGSYKRLLGDKYKENKAMVNDYLEQSEREKPRYRWYEHILIGAFHVITAIPFIIVGLICELRDWIRRSRK